MNDVAASVSACLQVHGSLTSDEIVTVADHWAPLDTRLRGFTAGAVTMNLFVKDRDQPGQHLTLETKIAGWPVLVATTSEPLLDHALNVVRDEMIRLVTDAKETHRPGRAHGTR